MSLITTVGTEYMIKNGFDGEVAIAVGLFDNSTDQLTQDTDLEDINTEPQNTNYTRDTSNFNAFGYFQNWGTDNDSSLTYDFSDQSALKNVDSWFIVVNFTSVEKADIGNTDHLFAFGTLDQNRNIGGLDTLNIAAGNNAGQGVGYFI